VTHVTGRSGEPCTIGMLPKVKLDTVMQSVGAGQVVQIIVKAVRTDNIGGGKISLLPVVGASVPAPASEAK